MTATLVLRLAGPLQSWGSSSQFNRRETDDMPTKSGIVGLLAAALGRSRSESIDDLVALALAVRIDQPGTLLRDFHTVSSLDGSPLLSASLSAKGRQKRVSNDKTTHVTHRFYLQDAVFVVAVGGLDRGFMERLAYAVRHPVFPLALGRRSCVPTQPIVLGGEQGDVWPLAPLSALEAVTWQASTRVQQRAPGIVDLPVTADRPEAIPAGALIDTRMDVPAGFSPGRRHLRSREVVHSWVTARPTQQVPSPHDPFDLLRGM